MKRNLITTLLLFFFALVLLTIIPVQAQTQNQQEILKQYIEELQKNPNDNALREKIIKFVLTMKPTPTIPEEARRYYVMAKSLFSDAKDSRDFQEAIEKFNKALLIAPWWSNANLDLGIALEANKEFDKAINSLKLFIAGNPGEEFVRKAQDEIYIIEAKKEKAIKEDYENALKAAQEKSKQEEKEKSELAEKILKEKLSSVEGNWKVIYADKRGIATNDPVGVHVTITKRGNNFVLNGPDWFFSQASFTGTGKILNGELRPNYADLQDLFDKPKDVLRQADGYVIYRGSITLSEDGKTINMEHDNVSITHSEERTLFSTKYKFVESENEPGWYKFTLERIEDRAANTNIEKAFLSLYYSPHPYMKDGISFNYPSDWYVKSDSSYEQLREIIVIGPKSALVKIFITKKNSPMGNLLQDQNLLMGVSEARIHILAQWLRTQDATDGRVSRPIFSNLQQRNEYFITEEKFTYNDVHFTRNYCLNNLEGTYVLLFDLFCDDYNKSETTTGFEQITSSFKYVVPETISKQNQDTYKKRIMADGAFVGLFLSAITPDIASQYSCPDTNGVMICGVIPDSPAYLAELKAEDIIIEFNGIKVTSLNQFSSIVQESPINKEIPITFIRDGNSNTTNVTLVIKAILEVDDIKYFY